MFDSLKGYKTYIVAVCMGLVVAAQYAGLVPQEAVDQVYALLGALGLAALRAGVSK